MDRREQILSTYSVLNPRYVEYRGRHKGRYKIYPPRTCNLAGEGEKNHTQEGVLNLIPHFPALSGNCFSMSNVALGS